MMKQQRLAFLEQECLETIWEQLPEPDDFLDQLWAKAGLKRRSWPEGLVVERYGTVEFG